MPRQVSQRGFVKPTSPVDVDSVGHFVHDP